MNFKKFLLDFIVACVICTSVFNNIYAENTVSGSSVEYEYDNDYNYDDYEEETTEATTSAPQTGITAPAGIPNNINVIAEGCALIDANTGIVLYGKNMNDRFYPASITKVLTGLLAVEYGHFEDIVTASFEAVNSIPWDSSKMNLAEDEQLSFENVIYGLMLKSGNDSAMVIAETVSGDVDAFVDKMNERARAVGAVNTHFVNPHGYHDEDHYTTAYDMALITREAVQNEEFNKIWGTEEREVLQTNKSDRRLMYHTDKMLHSEYKNYYYENLVGGKTGYHNKAMNTLVSYASMGKIDLICVVMKEPSYADAYADTKALFDYGFSLFKDTKIYSAQDYSATVPVVQYYKDKTIDLGTVAVAPASDYSAVVPEFIDISKVQTKVDLAESVEAPVAKGDSVGKITFNYDSYTLGSINITAQDNVTAISQAELIKQEKMEAFRKNIIRVLSVIAGAIVTMALFVLLLKLWFAGRKPKRRKATGRSSSVSGTGRSSTVTSRSTRTTGTTGSSASARRSQSGTTRRAISGTRPAQRKVQEPDLREKVKRSIPVKAVRKKNKRKIKKIKLKF